MIKVDTTNLRGVKAPLLFRPRHDQLPLPAVVGLGERGGVAAYCIYNPGCDKAPGMVEWRVDAGVQGDYLADLLERADVGALLERVHAGRSVEWDGQNFVLRLNEDATGANAALDEIFRGQPEIYG